MSVVTREPITVINAVVTAVQVTIPLLLAFGFVHITKEQSATIISAIAAWGGLVGTLAGRHLVTPVADPKDHEGNTLHK